MGQKEINHIREKKMRELARLREQGKHYQDTFQRLKPSDVKPPDLSEICVYKRAVDNPESSTAHDADNLGIIEKICSKCTGYIPPNHEEPCPKYGVKTTVLIIDDESDTRKVFYKIIADALKIIRGVNVINEAPDGQAAIDLMEKDNYDVVFTNLKMPKVDGIGVLNYIESKRPGRFNDVPVIGYGAEIMPHDLEKQGFDYAMQIPVDKEQLTGILMQAIKERHSESE